MRGAQNCLGTDTRTGTAGDKGGKTEIQREMHIHNRCVRTLQERQPLRFIDRFMLPALAGVTRQVAAFVGAQGEDVAMVSNATTGLNAVLRAYPLVAGDRVLALDSRYGSVNKMLTDLCARTGAVYDEVDVPYPLQDSAQVCVLAYQWPCMRIPDLCAACALQIVQAVRNALTPATRLAVFDHIASNTGQ